MPTNKIPLNRSRCHALDAKMAVFLREAYLLFPIFVSGFTLTCAGTYLRELAHSSVFFLSFL
ncbi:MAG TPA: hypothetical protein VGD78_03215 [Chthoniobacterales bacterium]